MQTEPPEFGFDELFADMPRQHGTASGASAAHSSPTSEPMQPSPHHHSSSMWPTTSEVLANHETRISALEEQARTPMHVASPTSSSTVRSPSGGGGTLMIEAKCPFASCSNRTGFVITGGRPAPPSHTVKHVKSKKHVEAALGLTQRDRAEPVLLLMCSCQPPTAPVSFDPRPFLSDAFRPSFGGLAANITFCAHRACLRLVAADPDELEALRLAAEAARRSAGGRKRGFANRSDDDALDELGDADVDDEQLRGDQTVAIEFAAVKFATPGAVYVLYDAARNQLRVQMERPPAAQPFHVAHVARMHRWMAHVIHLSPQHQEMWSTHAAVADAGFVDAFVLVSARVGLGAPHELTESARQTLHDGIAAGALVLCAGRSDGWLELMPRADVGSSHIPLPLAHLHPHTIRLFDANAQPSLPLLSTPTAKAVGGTAPAFDVRLRHFAPKAVGGTELKLEMLCKMSGWHLVAGELGGSELVSAVDRERASGHERLELLLEMMELEAASQQAAEAAAARRRALDAIAEAEVLRRENVALKRRLADAEKEARERADRDNEALREQVTRLHAQLQAAKAATAAAASSAAVASPAPAIVKVPSPPLASLSAPSPPLRKSAPSPPTAKAMLPIAKAGPGGKITRSSSSGSSGGGGFVGNVDSWFCEAQTAAEAEQEIERRKRTTALYYRRGDRQDLRLCVKLVDGQFAHSRISRAADGSFFAVREVAAPTIAALVLQELGLPNED